MALALHTTKKYDIEYGSDAIGGWEKIEKFIDFLRDLIRNDEEVSTYSDIYINEEETIIEIPFDIVEKYKGHIEWGEVFTTIWEESDHSNNYAHLDIW